MSMGLFMAEILKKKNLNTKKSRQKAAKTEIGKEQEYVWNCRL